MTFRFFTTLQPPAPGFEPCRPSKQRLLGAPMVMYVNSLEEILPLVERFRERVHGDTGARSHPGRCGGQRTLF